MSCEYSAHHRTNNLNERNGNCVFLFYRNSGRQRWRSGVPRENCGHCEFWFKTLCRWSARRFYGSCILPRLDSREHEKLNSNHKLIELRPCYSFLHNKIFYSWNETFKMIHSSLQLSAEIIYERNSNSPRARWLRRLHFIFRRIIAIRTAISIRVFVQPTQMKKKSRNMHIKHISTHSSHRNIMSAPLHELFLFSLHYKYRRFSSTNVQSVSYFQRK